MLRMKTVTVMVDDDPDTNFFMLKIGDTTVSWRKDEEVWLLDVGVGIKQKYLDDGDVIFAFINAVAEQFK